METYVAILRGINVSGQKLIRMEMLKRQMEELGFKCVSTYIQSGNIIFESEPKDKPAIAKAIEDKIYRDHGFQVPALVLDKFDVRRVLSNNPFLKRNNIDYLHVTLLSDVPKPTLVSSIDSDFPKPDEFFVVDETIYLFCPNGYGRTKLNNNFFEKKLKVTATTRNWKTMLKLGELIGISG